MKRSVSPRTAEDIDEPNKKRRTSGILQSLKRMIFLRPQFAKASQVLEATPNLDELESLRLHLEFVSKKRRQSVQENLKSSALRAPRASLSLGKGYGALSTTLQARRTSILGSLKSTSSEATFLRHDASGSRGASPLDGFTHEYILPPDIGNGQLSGEESDYAALYEDENGDIVRPPFINLDPRERYNLLQLKKSVEASEFLQKRLKQSESLELFSGIKKDESHLSDFNALRLRLAKVNRRNRQRKSAKGFFGGEFTYDAVIKPLLQSLSNNSGSTIGMLNKPTFDNGTQSILEAALMKPKVAHEGSLDNLGYKLKSIPGTSNGSAAPGPSFKLELTNSQAKDKVTSIEGEKNDLPVSRDTEQSLPLGTHTEAPVSLKRQQKVPEPIFAITKSITPPEGGNSSLLSTSARNEQHSKKEAPKFSFGKQVEEMKPSHAAPAFTFGNQNAEEKLPTEKPVFAFGKANSRENVPNGPSKKLLGVKNGETKSDVPILSFHGPAASSEKLEPESTSKNSTFSFGGSMPATGDKPGSVVEPAKPFSFGNGANSSFGGKAPLFEAAKDSQDSSTSKATSIFAAPADDGKAPFSTPSSSFAGSNGAANPFALSKNGAFSESPEVGDDSASVKKRSRFSEGLESKPTLLGTTSSKFNFSKGPNRGDTPTPTKDGPNLSGLEFAQSGKRPSSEGSGSAPSNGGKSGFNFSKSSDLGSSSRATPTLPNASEPKPAFSFGAAKSTTPVPGTGESSGISSTFENKEAAFGQLPKPSFNFAQTSNVDPALIFGGGSAAPTTEFNFSASSGSTQFKFGSGAPASGPSQPAFGSGNQSRSATPVNTTFGSGWQNQNSAGPAFGQFPQLSATPAFGGPALGGPTPTFGSTPPPSFSFGGNTMSNQLGQTQTFSQDSRESTPSAGAAIGQPGAPMLTFTPPLVAKGRKIASMRPRKRF